MQNSNPEWCPPRVELLHPLVHHRRRADHQYRTQTQFAACMNKTEPQLHSPYSDHSEQQTSQAEMLQHGGPCLISARTMQYVTGCVTAEETSTAKRPSFSDLFF